MLADHWVIAQLIGQASSFVLILFALVNAFGIMRWWDPQSSSELQLNLERRTYLVSVLIKYVLIFQILTLVLFLVTVNNHLPGLIKGAMCASGTLSLNDYGYPYLGLKITAVFIYILFLFMNYLDQAEPGYPLTPGKFRLIPLIFILVTADLTLLVTYFGSIEPDIIATCCSISFSAANRWDEGMLAGGSLVDLLMPVFYITPLFLIWAVLKGRHWFALILGFLFVPVAVYLLKYHFVKFIYALPTHNCLFDIFWIDYFYIGYILFGCLFILITMSVLTAVLNVIRPKLNTGHSTLPATMRISTIITLLLFVVLVSAYWWYWITFRL